MSATLRMELRKYFHVFISQAHLLAQQITPRVGAHPCVSEMTADGRVAIAAFAALLSASKV
jgi:hypothetical protein